MKKAINTIVVLLCICNVFAQQSINTYKYIIVPNKFDFVKKPDMYKTSSLTKFLFNKYGFTAFLDIEELPKDVERNRCLALTAEVIDKSKVFVTKSFIVLKDCKGNIVHTSLEGNSRIKEYGKAYNQSIREAFNSIKKLNYTYVASNQPKEKEFVKEERKVDANIVKKKITLTQNKVSILIAKHTKKGLVLENKKQQNVHVILKTALPSIFVIKGKDGVLYKNNTGIWVAEFYDEKGVKIIKEYKIDFNNP